MKDITPVELLDKRVLTFTRPQYPGTPELGGKGQIGSVILDNKDQLKDSKNLEINAAPLIETRFKDGTPENNYEDAEWGGIKHAVVLNDRKVGVVLHIARFDDSSECADWVEKPKIYSTCTAVYNIHTRRLEETRIVAIASEFTHQDGSNITPKKEVLKDVAFGTGITDPNADGDVMLIVGVGDSTTCYKKMKDPWARHRA
jgi:Protein of unknown function (DUF1861)